MIIGDMSRKLRAVPLGVPLAVLSAGTGLSLLAGSRQLHSLCGIGCLGLSIHRPADGRHQAAGQVAAPLHGQGNVPTLYAKSWSGTGNFLNSQVRRLTGNSFDISALISLFFLIRGIRKMLVYGQRPSGPSMIWWALHLMKGWRK